MNGLSSIICTIANTMIASLTPTSVNVLSPLWRQDVSESKISSPFVTSHFSSFSFVPPLLHISLIPCSPRPLLPSLLSSSSPLSPLPSLLSSSSPSSPPPLLPQDWFPNDAYNHFNSHVLSPHLPRCSRLERRRLCKRVY